MLRAVLKGWAGRKGSVLCLGAFPALSDRIYTSALSLLQRGALLVFGLGWVFLEHFTPEVSLVEVSFYSAVLCRLPEAEHSQEGYPHPSALVALLIQSVLQPAWTL